MLRRIAKRHDVGACPGGLLPARGFTLVELLITLGVGAVLLTVAVPAFQRLTMSSRLTTQANELVAALNFARSEAIKRNTSLSLCRSDSPTTTDCVTANGPWEYWIVRNGAGSVIRRGTIGTYSGSLVLRSTLSDDQAAFGSDGLVRTNGVLVDNQRLDVCANSTLPNNIRRVTLGSGSRISTESLTGGC
jgi:type IV fimbrial biogenesis protein FimT